MATTDKVFILPDLGEGLTEAEIVNWLVAEGDTVVVDQPIIEVESAKSIVELPCPFAGVVHKLHAAAGDTIHSGQPVITVAVAGAAASADEAAVDVLAGDVLAGDVLAGSRDSKRPPREGRFGRRGSSATPPVTGMAATAPSPSPKPRADSPTVSGVSPVVSPLVSPVVSPVVSPLVRRLAKEHGFEAHTLNGSGPRGLVMRADVETHIAAGSTAGTAQLTSRQPASAQLASAQLSSAQLSSAQLSSAPGDLRIPITGLRKIVAERMSASRREIPEATIWLDVDATELLAAKDQLQRSTGERWSINALLARFVVAGLTQWPILNSSVDMAAGEIVQHSAINLGFAAQTARGLMVPVIHGAGEMTTGELRDALTTLVETAKTGSFPNDQLRGGTFTLNNYGGFGMDGSAPIINQPEVAMLGVGRILDRPWVVDGEIVVRKVMVLSMVFDHRVCDGDVPSEFMGFMTRCIQNPIALLGGL